MHDRCRQLGARLLAPLSIASLAIFASIMVTLGCGGGDDGASASTNPEGGTSDTSPITGRPDAGGEELPPNPAGPGCIYEGPWTASDAVTVARPDGAANAVPWTTPALAQQEDRSFSRTELGSATETQLLRLSNFHVTVPDNFRLTGVVAQLIRHAPEGGISDGQIEIIAPAKSAGRGKFLKTPWPKAIVGTHHYGAAEDLWGIDNLTLDDVKRDDFAVTVWAKKEDGTDVASPQALVDSLAIFVNYCPK